MKFYRLAFSGLRPEDTKRASLLLVLFDFGSRTPAAGLFVRPCFERVALQAVYE